MIVNYLKYSAGIILLVSLLIFGSCNMTPGSKDLGKRSSDSICVDFAEIKKRGKLVAITGYNSTSYFLYKGRAMGFEYELLKKLADHLEVDLEIEIAQNMDEVFDMLNNGIGDVVAYGLTITKERKKTVAFTSYLNIVNQVLVQRKPDNWDRMTYKTLDKNLIRNPIDLIDKDVYVRKNSSYYSRLQNLSDEIGGDINVVAVTGNIGTDELIKMVSKGTIKYTVADQHIALINQTYYSNIDIKTAISFPQRIAWAVRKNSPELQNAINSWIGDTRKTTEYNMLYNKYFKNRRAYASRMESEYYSHAGGKLSQYDKYIKKYANEIDMDWRLLASIIYQESNFIPNLESWAGAQGLMQLLPSTGKQYGVDSLMDPIENMYAGTRYLQWLNEFWEDIPDTLERQKFVLASYNVGQGHVLDAVRLAKKYKRDPDKWKGNIDYYILNKSKPKYYRDEVVKHGYCRGEEPYKYVKDVLERYEHYKKLIN